MEKQKIIYFRPKFWPDREYRKPPDGSRLLVDEPAITDVMRFRQEMRLYYRNWIDVWRTYSYFTNYGIIVIPLIGLLSRSWIVFLALAIPFMIFKRHIGNKLWDLNGLRIIVPGVFDYLLTPVFGYLPPFEDEVDNL